MKSDPHIVTLRDIALKLGISHTTVSRALHNSPFISEARRKEIQKAAKKIGYVPNAMAVGLGKQRQSSGTHAVAAGLAWLNCWPAPARLRQFKEFDFYWRGAAEAASKAGYHLEEFACASLSLKRLEKIFEARNIRGVLVPPIWMGTSYPAGWDDFPWGRFSVVRFGYSCQSPAFHVVAGAQMNNACMAIRKMAEKGYRRIGYVGYTGITDPWTRFHAGYLLAQNALPLSLRMPILSLPREGELPETQALIAAWIKEYRPEAILTDIAHLSSMIEKVGYRVPADIGVACTSVLDGGTNAGIDQNSEEIGRTAVHTLISLLTLQERGVPEDYREVLIQGRWVDGSMMPGRVG